MPSLNHSYTKDPSTMRPTLSKKVFVAAALTLPLLAHAHTGAGLGAHGHAEFLDGLAHPFTGLDHLAAMLTVGFWSALTARRIWLAPLTFVAMLLAGALLGMAGLAVPAVEPMIATSLLVFGLMLALRARLPATLAVAMVGVFAVFHGLAHGAVWVGGEQPWKPLLGMLAGTVVLHLTGLGLGLVVRERSLWWPRLACAAVTLLGGALLLQMV